MQKPQAKVAVIGTGLAGLTTGYLLQQDRQERYAVTLIDQVRFTLCSILHLSLRRQAAANHSHNLQSDELSFAAASVAVHNTDTNATEQIDLPMRASAGGYYANLMEMYRYLRIPMHPIRFLFVFARALSNAVPLDTPRDAGAIPGSYFVHASNMHQLIPPRPAGSGLLKHVLEILYLIICHFWFSVACFVVTPGKETVAEYIDRIWLPKRYANKYLLPLMSSVSTCSHAEMLAFPASDVVNYKRKTTGQHHYAVCGGAHQVQDKLAAGVQDIRLSTRVVEVKALEKGVMLRMQGEETVEETFDHVVLAVSPDVAARIYSPLAKELSVVPTIQAESAVLGESSVYKVVAHDSKAACAHHSSSRAMPAQVISFRTQGATGKTEALHAMPGGAVVTTCPFDEGETKDTLKLARFTRTLRTPTSREVVSRLMSGEGSWANGQDGVWLAGSWCWDGMVLLEGCVVSAIRVAEDLGVAIPWEGA